MHSKYLLTLAVALAVVVAMLVYAILRVVRVPWYHAGLIAALTIAYPWFDSTRFWDSGSIASLGIAFALGGLLVALIGIRRASLRFHACAAVLYLLSVLTYEITIPLIAAAGLLYVGLVGWRRAAPLWCADLAVVIAGGLWAATHTPRSVSDASGGLGRLLEIVEGGGELLGRTLVPIGAQPHTTLALGVLGAILVAGLLVYLTTPNMRAERQRWGLRQWLLLAMGGLFVAGLGWAMLIPADPYYTPTIYGESNRINSLAGLGLVIVVYATLGIVGTLLGALLKRRGLAVVTTLLLGAVLGAAYIHVLERHGRLWDAAFRAEMAGIEKMQEVFPTLPPNTAVFAGNYPASLTLGVPIFASTWGLDGLAKLRYEDGSIRAYPITSEVKLVCRSKGMVVKGWEAVDELTPYGSARLLDLSTGRHSTPRNRPQCLRERDSYPPGPLYVSTAY
jgi:hypothetical protein